LLEKVGYRKEEPRGSERINIGRVYIDRYSPGRNPYQYKLSEYIDIFGAVHEWTGYRMTRQEFYAYLNGLISGIETALNTKQ
jgi:hypothetical protein